MTTPKRPRDTNQLAKMVVDLSTGQLDAKADSAPRHPMSELGRSGGLKGGRARADKLSSSRRAEIARQAAAARWLKDDS
jgi:hypothetical protein